MNTTTNTTTACPYCGAPTEIRCDSVIYGRRYGDVLICTRWPACRSYVGVHAGTRTPKGTLADEATRQARILAHAEFDPLWRSGGMSRKAAYRWLAGALGIPAVHIGYLDVAACRRVVEVCQGKAGRGPEHREGQGDG